MRNEGAVALLCDPTRNEGAVALLCDLPAHFVLPSSVPRYARVAVKMRCQDVEAMTPVGKLYGVGTVTTE